MWASARLRVCTSIRNILTKSRRGRGCCCQHKTKGSSGVAQNSRHGGMIPSLGTGAAPLTASTVTHPGNCLPHPRTMFHARLPLVLRPPPLPPPTRPPFFPFLPLEGAPFPPNPPTRNGSTGGIVQGATLQNYSVLSDGWGWRWFPSSISPFELNHMLSAQ